MGLFRFSDTQLSKLAGRCSSRVRALGSSNKEDVTLSRQSSASEFISSISRRRGSRSSNSSNASSGSLSDGSNAGGSRSSSISNSNSRNNSNSNSSNGLEGGRFQIRVCDAWLEVDEAENRQLLESVSAGLSVVQIEHRAQIYEYDNLQTLQDMHQTNLLTGRQRALRFVPRAGRPAVAPTFVLDKKGRPSVDPTSAYLRETVCAGDRGSAARPAKCMPYWLSVELPHTPASSGLYHMQVGMRPNGLPIWCHSDSDDAGCENWLFSTEDNHWVIVADGEVVALSPVHQGKGPHEFLGSWQHNRSIDSLDCGIKVDEVDESELQSTDDDEFVSEYSEGMSPSQLE
mmetsp:Transcript_55626/g.118455  ORF Transcript_55626/g.118455 Transcript_55626/m.118455 type:complete len:344 (-) Transcript_55626:57-1088(-)